MQPRVLNQSLSSYISEHLDEIEKLISVGVYQDSICQQLTLLGFTPSLATFKKSLARARQKRLGLAITQVGAINHDAKRHTAIGPIRGNRLSADEFGLLAHETIVQSQVAESAATLQAQNALATLAKLKLTANEMAEITALAERISTRAAEGL
jgi:hypothetical protein